MTYRILSSIIILCLLATVLFLPRVSTGEEPKLFIPDKALCAKMIRFGKQAYTRGKYLDAKEYFRKAVQADPMSQVAWKHYDMAAIFALAEKVEKNTDLIAPDSSVPSPPPAPPAPPIKKGGAQIEEEEGC